MWRVGAGCGSRTASKTSQHAKHPSTQGILAGACRLAWFMAACSKALFYSSPVSDIARRSSAPGASEYVAWRAVVRKLQSSRCRVPSGRTTRTSQGAKAHGHHTNRRSRSNRRKDRPPDRQRHQPHTRPLLRTDEKEGCTPDPGRLLGLFCVTCCGLPKQLRSDGALCQCTPELRELKCVRHHTPSLVGCPWCRSRGRGLVSSKAAHPKCLPPP